MTTSLAIPARTALVHINKGKKCFVAADAIVRENNERIRQLQSRGENHFITAGRLFAKIKDEHTRADGAWASVCKKQCGLQQHRVDFYIRVSEGRADAQAYKKADAARKRTQRSVGKSSSGTGKRPTGTNSQSDAGVLECQSNPNIDKRSKLLNEILEGLRLAKQCVGTDLSELFDFRPLAKAASQAAKQWQMAAKALRRRAESEKRQHQRPEAKIRASETAG